MKCINNNERDIKSHTSRRQILHINTHTPTDTIADWNKYIDLFKSSCYIENNCGSALGFLFQSPPDPNCVCSILALPMLRNESYSILHYIKVVLSWDIRFYIYCVFACMRPAFVLFSTQLSFHCSGNPINKQPNINTLHTHTYPIQLYITTQLLYYIQRKINDET